MRQEVQGILSGTIRVGMRTKELLKTIPTGSIAAIYHEDLDHLAAQGLAEARVKAVLNGARTISGSFPHDGVKPLIERNIPVYDIPDSVFSFLRDEMTVHIRGNTVEVEGKPYPCRLITEQTLFEMTRTSCDRWLETCMRFIGNTFAYADQEKELILKPLDVPKLRVRMAGRPVVIVVRGAGYVEDLHSLQSYINRANPVLIGVDGGADALLAAGYRPHCIVGDMDSISDQGLRSSGAELIVHAYANGFAPGWKRVRQLGLTAHQLFTPGTSEDMAMLLAYEQQAEVIISVGAHTHITDFLQKGRQGMASTLLVRMKIGDKLIDAKGFSKLYPCSPSVSQEATRLPAYAWQGEG
ncbi:MAG: putative rane-anchored protein [Paenibacillus sp.]|nr:putative rane-anchored protein [Paenibacillus sp.]